jgi:hypothetical protein
MEEGETTQWPKEKGQREETTIYKTLQRNKNHAIRTPLKLGGGLGCSWGWRVNSSCSTCSNRRVTLVTNPVISHEWGNDQIVITTNETHPWSWRRLIFFRSDDFNLTTRNSLGSVASLVAATPITEIMKGITSSGKSDQLRDIIYSIIMQVLLECCYI